MYTRPSPIARPRVWAKNDRDTIASSISGLYDQIRLPVAASSFHTVDGLVEIYIAPSTTNGVLCRPCRDSPGWKIQATCRSPTLFLLISASGLYRHAVSTVRWYEHQSPGGQCRMRSASESAHATDAVIMPVVARATAAATD